MMSWMDISAQTGPFLHGAHRVAHLSFRTQSVPRSFSVVMASAYVSGEFDFDRNGIAIIDNDTRTVVLDEHLKDDMDGQRQFLAGAPRLSWSRFSEFVSSHPRYRQNVSDIGLDRPEPGNPTNQIHSGATLLPKSEDDIRSPALIASANEADCPYNFPPISAEKARASLRDHHFSEDHYGRLRFAWQLDISKPLFDEGKVSGNGAADIAWGNAYLARPELKHEILVEIQKPVMEMEFTAWPDGQQGRFSFMSLPSGSIGLDKIDGELVAYADLNEMHVKVGQMDDVALRELWIAVHCADHDLSPITLESAFKAKLRDERIAFEVNCGMTRPPRNRLDPAIDI